MDETDSALGDDDLCTPCSSLRSSIYHYRYENGRRFHAFRDGQYLIPNDEAEQDRLELLHLSFKLILDGALFSAPISNPERILDIGTGTGIWAIEVADKFPMAEVIGTDLSPIQPTWVPPNCKFFIEDAESEWSFHADERFDFVHGRALCGGIADWPKFYAQALQNLKPGGWIEMQEHACWIQSDDDTVDRIPRNYEVLKELDRASMMFGKRMNVAHLHRQWMMDVGFVNVQEDIHKV
jgi:SAM-dependent methyltransferase